MKNLTKQILIFIFTYSLLLNTAFGQRNIAVFNTPVTLDEPLVNGEFPTGYPVSIGASHVRDCAARGLGAADLREIYDAVVNSVNLPVQPVGNPVLAAFFTTAYDGDTLTVIKAKTHGFCFAFHVDSNLTLYYFEENGNGSYDWVENLTTRIYSVNEDLFLSLHYCQFSPGSFPDKSTVYSFVCDSIGRIGVADFSDLSITLSKDYKRQAGLFSLGMADSAILSSFETPNGESNCGGACITHVANSYCAMIMNTNGFVVYSCMTNMGNCAVGAIERRVRDENIILGVPVRFKMMRDFRDIFMTDYCEGRKYIGFYYTFSKYAKMSISMLWKYASVLRELYVAMENLSDESTDKIIVTQSLKEKVLEILLEHRNAGDSYFQSILDDVAADMEMYEGLRRSELISLLSPYGNCNGERKSIPGQVNFNSYFATVYENHGLDEIVVNYAVSGSRIKFELFSSTAGLVYSASNTLPRQRLIISTSEMGPGIYVYRISSDSGYEKVGKVAVVK